MAGALLLLSGCASDEFTWRGKEIDSDKVMITLHRADFDRATAGTRSVDPGTTITDLRLVTFKSDGTFSNIIPIQSNQIDGTGTDEEGDDIYAITIPYDKIENEAGHWYFFANAKNEITTWAAGQLADKHETKLSNIVFDKTSQWDAASSTGLNAVLFTPKIEMAKDDIQPGQILNGAKSTPLKRIYGKLDFKINLNSGKTDQKAYNLQVTGVALLQKSPEKGDIIGTAATAPVEAAQLSDVTWTTPTGSQIYTGNAGVAPSGSLLKNTALTLRTFPLAKELNTAKKQVLLVVRGRYQSGDKDENGNVTAYTSHDVYYAVPVDGIAANQYWTATIDAVGSGGYEDFNEAIENPTGLSMTFSDNTPDITSMVSDGANALAIGDTITINSAGNRIVVNGTDQTTFSVRFRYSTDETTPVADMLEYNCINNAGNVIAPPSWLHFERDGDIILDGTSDKERLQWYVATFKVTSTANSGTDRDCKFRFGLKDRSMIVRDVVFQQKAATGYNAVSDAFSISLGITNAASSDNTTINDYGTFVKTAGSTNGTTVCDGIFPNMNGGRIRNEGLHIPMPNDDEVVYTYTVKINTSKISSGSYTLSKSSNFPSDFVTVTGSPLSGTVGSSISWTVTCKANGNYDYTVYRDALILKVGENEYSLDLYHTGFFHKVNSRWGYYEVFTVPSTGSHWLDRNLGARAAGMAVQDASAALTGTWPLSSVSSVSAAGEYLAKANVAGQMPKGWNLPSYGNFEALFSQAEFIVTPQLAMGGVSYTAPSFSFASQEFDRNGNEIAAAPKSIRAYFPCVRYKQNDVFKGGNKSGYFMTSTQASGNYYQVAMFQGMNLITNTLNFDGTLKMPVRPMISGSSSGNMGAKMYECNVQGYTHVALYAYNKSTGLKTWLTTWPGEQVVPYSATMTTNEAGPLTVSKHFSKQVYYDYESNPDVELRVVFNICDQQGNVTHSNMVTETNVPSTMPYVGSPVQTELTAHKAARDGIKFRNGATYSRQNWIDAGAPAAGAKNGNWSGGKKKLAQIVLTFPRLVKDNAIYDYIYIQKGTSAVTYNGTGKVSDGLYKATEGSNGYYTVTLDIPYQEDDEATITASYLKDLISRHKFYKSATLNSSNEYESTYVGWQANDGVGVKYGTFNNNTKTLNVTVWNRVGTTPPTPAEKPIVTKIGFRWLKTDTGIGKAIAIAKTSGSEWILQNLKSDGSLATDWDDEVWSGKETKTIGDYYYTEINAPENISDILGYHYQFEADRNDQTFGAHFVEETSFSSTTYPNLAKLYTVIVGTKKNLYLRGEISGWDAKEEYKFSSADDKTFILNVPGMTQGEFKIADNSFSESATFGGLEGDLTDGTFDITTWKNGGNMKLKDGGNVTFIFVKTDKNDWSKGGKLTIRHN